MYTQAFGLNELTPVAFIIVFYIICTILKGMLVKIIKKSAAGSKDLENMSEGFNGSISSLALDFINSSSEIKSKTQRFIKKYSGYYICAASASVLIITVLSLNDAINSSFCLWRYKLLVFLLALSPFALAMSVPLGYLGGISAALRSGVLIKNEALLEALNNITTVVFDKTGVLTKGVLKASEMSRTISRLRELYEIRIALLSGDSEAADRPIAESIKIDEYYSELSPDEKLMKIQEIKDSSYKPKLVFVGADINNAPMRAISDIGVSVGWTGSDAVIETSDIILLTGEPCKLIEAVNTARKTYKAVRQNTLLVFCVKAAILVLGASGAATVLHAVFADICVTLLAVLNTLRMLNPR